MIQLTNMTISQYLSSLIPRNCIVCNELLEGDDKQILLPCGCFYCISCIKKKIIVDTDHRIVLNDFEKLNDKYRNNKPKCICLKEYDVSVIVDMIFPMVKMQYVTKAIDRLMISMQKTCSICGDDKMNRSVIGIDIPIIDPYAKESKKIVYKQHIICLKCKKDNEQRKKEGKTQDQKLLQQSNNSSFLTTNNKFFCIFCKENHDFNPNSTNSNTNRSNKPTSTGNTLSDNTPNGKRKTDKASTKCCIIY